VQNLSKSINHCTYVHVTKKSIFDRGETLGMLYLLTEFVYMSAAV